MLVRLLYNPLMLTHFSMSRSRTVNKTHHA